LNSCENNWETRWAKKRGGGKNRAKDESVVKESGRYKRVKRRIRTGAWGWSEEVQWRKEWGKKRPQGEEVQWSGRT
jgi:hypothetical protein